MQMPFGVLKNDWVEPGNVRIRHPDSKKVDASSDHIKHDHDDQGDDEPGSGLPEKADGSIEQIRYGEQVHVFRSLQVSKDDWAGSWELPGGNPAAKPIRRYFR